jgi:hypothetical protein
VRGESWVRVTMALSTSILRKTHSSVASSSLPNTTGDLSPFWAKSSDSDSPAAAYRIPAA